MADAVIVSIAEGIITNLVPRALERVGNLWGIKHELEVLRNTVSELRAVLYNAEEQYYRDCQIQDWLDKLKDAFYDIQDLLEEFDIEAIRRELRGHNEMIKEVRAFFSNSNQLAFKLKMSYKVRAARERIETIKAERNFPVTERPADLQGERERRKREEMYSTHNGDFIGRENDKKRVYEFLLDLHVKEEVSILPIVGTGGIGKTALAHYLYNDEILSKRFDFKVWVRISIDLDVKEIAKHMIACAKMEEPTEFSMERLQSELRREIKGKRYLLVLDDLLGVTQEQWQSLKDLLLGSARGSKILITTRSDLVAKITGTALPYPLSSLSERESLHLLLRAAHQEMQDPELLAIGEEIVRKCHGIPLAVRTIGNLLFSKKTTDEWLHFKDYMLPQVSQREDSIMSILKLSYDHLPSHLKQCFDFCSLFPKDYMIKKQTLVNLWVAAGFILPSNGSQHVEDIAHEYFMDLLSKSFFQDFQKDPITKVETCKMHDLMHDVALNVAGTEFAGTECQQARDHTKCTRGTRHVSSDSMDKLPTSWLTENLVRTFLYVPPYGEIEQKEPTSKVVVCQLIQSFKKMRILDLHATIVKKVPRSICMLKHLKYLDLSQNKEIKRLPISITRLHHLQTLNLCGCSSLEELPRGIKKLVSLRNLDLDGCSRLSFLPRGLGQLSSLHTLTRFILPSKKALAKNYCKLRELNGLNNIKGSLSIETLGYITDASAESRAADLIAKHSLKSLILRWGYLDTDDPAIGDEDEALLDGLRPHSNLQKLTINRYNGKTFPKWMTDFLPNLVKVRLLRCGRCKHLPQLGRLPHLKSLEIWMLTELESIESDHSSTAAASFPSLLRLKIRHCENLKAMPLAPLIEHLVLKEVDLQLINCIHALNKLKSLDISQMEFLKCLPEKFLQSLTSLEHLEISECPKLNSLSLGTRHLSNLVHLSFSNCEELDLSEGESDNFLDLKGLESLQFVDILGVPKLTSLPQWLLQVNLKQLSIKKCLNLKALPEQIKALQSLILLEIVQCPLLTSLPEAMRRLMSLNHLRIAGCPKLEERCTKDAGKDWYKIAHIPHITHELEYYEHHL
ncbi:putative disease resistance protein RGA4 [Eucalyptus grandis]|uniref:putative disease resistance protein RGA4 n=1 Tax=Eucalyptus grandis TaxID=71139 RepID=UPI00192EBAEB|nr:putative disease resistance protein RGA4 [Eucalyptus grandis]